MPPKLWGGAEAEGTDTQPLMESNLPFSAASAAGARSALAAGTAALPFWLPQLFGVFSYPCSALGHRARQQPEPVSQGPPRPPAEGAEFGLGTAGNFRQRGRDGCTRSRRRRIRGSERQGYAGGLPGSPPRRQHRHRAPLNPGENHPGTPRGARQARPACRWVPFLVGVHRVPPSMGSLMPPPRLLPLSPTRPYSLPTSRGLPDPRPHRSVRKAQGEVG